MKVFSDEYVVKLVEMMGKTVLEKLDTDVMVRLRRIETLLIWSVLLWLMMVLVAILYNADATYSVQRSSDVVLVDEAKLN